MEKAAERRQYARIRLEMPASVIICQLDFQHSGAIVDLSLGGCYFPLVNDLASGTECRIQLTVGEGLESETVDLAGVVVRNDGQGLGIKFTNLSDEVQLILTRVIARAGASRGVN